MTKLTGTDAHLAAQCAAPGGCAGHIRPGMGWPTPSLPRTASRAGGCARCARIPSHPPCWALPPWSARGCPRCVLADAAAGTARHRRNRPELRARMLARWHRHEWQSSPLARVPDITLPPTTVEPAGYDLRAPSVVGPGRDTARALVPPLPVHHYPRAAR